jgi:hypothetical protein
MTATRKPKPGRFTASIADERDEIASTTVNRFKTVRPYVLLAHLYLMTRHQGDQQEAETQQDQKEYASLSDLLMHASAMVMTPDFRRMALSAMNEAKANRLVEIYPVNWGKQEETPRAAMDPCISITTTLAVVRKNLNAQLPYEREEPDPRLFSFTVCRFDRSQTL